MPGERTTSHARPTVARTDQIETVGGGPSMDLRDCLRMFRRGWAMIMAFVLLLMGLAVCYLVVTPKRYESTTVLLIVVGGAVSSGDLQQGADFSAKAVATYAQIVDSATVLGPVAAQMSPPASADELVDAVGVAVPTETTLIDITATAGSPEQAAALANATAMSAANVLPALAGIGGVRPLVRVQQTSRAVAPASPSSPDTKKTLAIGLLVGVSLGLAATIARQSLDTRIHRVEDVHAVTDLAVLGVLPRLTAADHHDLAARDDPDGAAGQAFRTLRTNLRFLETTGRRSLVVAAAAEDGDDAQIVINLAWTMAQERRRVLVVDLDLRRSPVAEFFDLDGPGGLSDVLSGRAELARVTQGTDHERLRVVGSGMPPSSPSDLLNPPVLSAAVRQMEHENDCVLLNAPPVLSNSDAASASSVATGVVVTISAGRTRSPQLLAALEALARVQVKPIGVVLVGGRRSPRWRRSAVAAG